MTTKRLIPPFKALKHILWGATFLLAGCVNGTQIKPEMHLDSENALPICPPFTLAENNKNKLLYHAPASKEGELLSYQTELSDAARTCVHNYDNIILQPVVAGWIFAEKNLKDKTVYVPLRILAYKGNEVIYSNLYRYPVEIVEDQTDIQFIFTDAQIILPRSDLHNIQVSVGIG
ncbi:hypothetical protein [Bartonella sp. DGB2]|uniref:hypothetical protein n=1 Tax=Bartonella sp. DGB2 TaxID=3388426 RepID=UPI00398FA7DA